MDDSKSRTAIRIYLASWQLAVLWYEIINSNTQLKMNMKNYKRNKSVEFWNVHCALCIIMNKFLLIRSKWMSIKHFTSKDSKMNLSFVVEHWTLNVAQRLTSMNIEHWVLSANTTRIYTLYAIVSLLIAKSNVRFRLIFRPTANGKKNSKKGKETKHRHNIQSCNDFI